MVEKDKSILYKKINVTNSMHIYHSLSFYICRGKKTLEVNSIRVINTCIPIVIDKIFTSNAYIELQNSCSISRKEKSRKKEERNGSKLYQKQGSQRERKEAFRTC